MEKGGGGGSGGGVGIRGFKQSRSAYSVLELLNS